MKRDGFTLIELLAVILILGIIALIAIPTVNRIIDESRMGAFGSTLTNINKKVEETCLLEKMKDFPINSSYVIKNGKIDPSLDIKGDLPDGEIYVDKDCNVTFNLNNGIFVGNKDNPDQKPVIEKCPNQKCPDPPSLILKDPNKTKSYVGYYADVEGDGIVDGIIFADLLTGNIGSGEWADVDGIYTIPTIPADNIKNYYISNNEYAGIFGSKKVIKPVKNDTGSERFYIMSLKDFNNTKFYWYFNGRDGMADALEYTSVDFGSGRENTSKMIVKWDASGYGDKVTLGPEIDIWGPIKSDVAKGWFIPSRAEWSAFAEELGFNQDNFTDFKLDNYYWTSSHCNTFSVWRVGFNFGYMSNFGVNNLFSVRLAKTI